MLILASSRSLGPVFAGFRCGAAVSRPAARFIGFPVPRVFSSNANSDKFLFPSARVSWFPLWGGCFSPCREISCQFLPSSRVLVLGVSFSHPGLYSCGVANSSGFSWLRANFQHVRLYFTLQRDLLSASLFLTCFLAGVLIGAVTHHLGPIYNHPGAG